MSGFVPVVIGNNAINMANVTDMYRNRDSVEVFQVANQAEETSIFTEEQAVALWEWWCERAEHIGGTDEEA